MAAKIPPDDLVWEDMRRQYESNAAMGVRALHKLYGRRYAVTELDIEQRADAEGWCRVAEVLPAKGGRAGKAGEAAGELPEIAEMADALVRQIVAADSPTPELIARTAKFGMICAIQARDLGQLHKWTDLAGRHKDTQAWKETAEPRSQVTVNTTSPEDIQRLTDKLVEVVRGASPSAQAAVESIRTLVTRRADEFDSPARPH